MFNYKVDKTKVELDVTIDNKEWDEGVNKVYENTKSKFNVVGFRKGHAPKKVIEQQYGDTVFFEDTVEYFMRKVLNEFLREHPEFEPVSYPKTTMDSFTIDKGLKFKIEIEIMPEYKVCPYTGLTFKKKSVKVSEKEIEHEIHHLLEDNAQFQDVERESKMGDSLLIDFVGSIDGVEFEGGKAENYPLTLGSHSFIDTFEDQLVGKKKGDLVDVNVTFPEDYGAKEYAGKKALFKVTVNAVREKVLPSLDDKFVADATEFETVAEYKNHVKEHIQSMKEKNADAEVETEIVDYLVANSEIEVPQSMIDAEVEENIHRLRDGVAMYKITLEDYLSQMGTTLEEYKKSCTERAVKNIKARYIFRKIIEEQKLLATNEEVEAKLSEMPRAKGQDIREEDRVYVENSILLEKLYKFLKENNKIESV